MRYLIRELAIIGQYQKALRITVQTAHGKKPSARAYQIEHGPMGLLPVVRSDISGRLVDQVIAAPGALDHVTLETHCIGMSVNSSTYLAHATPVDRDFPGADKVLTLTA
jgi:hypothetical protein